MGLPGVKILLSVLSVLGLLGAGIVVFVVSSGSACEVLDLLMLSLLVCCGSLGFVYWVPGFAVSACEVSGLLMLSLLGLV